jgi:hypothetical protein
MLFWQENLEGRELSADLGTDGKIILKCILKTYGGYGLDLSQDLFVDIRIVVEWILSSLGA